MFQRGWIPPQLLSDPHPGSAEYVQLPETGATFVLILNDHVTVCQVDLCYHEYYGEEDLTLQDGEKDP